MARTPNHHPAQAFHPYRRASPRRKAVFESSPTKFRPNRLLNARKALTEDPYVTEFDDEQQDIDIEDQPTFHWSEEKTLVSDLLGVPANTDDCDETQLMDLYERLTMSFDEEKTAYAKEAADTLLSSVRQLRGSYSKMDKRFNNMFAAGILTVNNACKDTETLWSEMEQELESALNHSKEELDNLLKALEAAYKRRDQLWQTMEKALDDIVFPAQEILKDTPVKIERSVTIIEKHSKNVKDDGESALKSILDKLS